MSYFSFLGCWRLFLLFYKLYPNYHKHIAIATLFIPSVFFWGAAGLLKDTVVMACVGFIAFYSHRLLIEGKEISRSILILGFCIYISFLIKPYVIIAFVPSLAVWVFLTYESRIKNNALRLLAKPLFILLGVTFAGFFVLQLSSGSERYSSDKMLDFAQAVQSDHGTKGLAGHDSMYSLGDIDPSPAGIAKKIPAAIIVTLFRPYLWEMKKPIFLPSGIEGFLCMLFTIYIFLSVGIINTLKKISSNPNIVFCFVFAFIFAFSVGFTSFNFGALARFKIPALPFYYVGLVILYNETKKKKKKAIDKPV
jgi:hypothetical protein